MPTLNRVGITQRSVSLPERDETRDALDVRLARLIWALGFVPIPLSNIETVVTSDFSGAETTDYLTSLALDAVVLSGGDDVGEPPARDRTERAAVALAEQQGLPVLGICRGMQLLNVIAGGTLTPVEGHIATRHTVKGPHVAGREVNSFHRLAISADGVGQDLEPIAWAPDGTVEAIQHPRLAWTGIMWHPEREQPFAAQDMALITEALIRPRP